MSQPPGNERLIAGRYRLLAALGEGGMGTVWRARDDILGREVAVKEVRAPAGLPSADRDRLHARLEREAWAAARISHRNVVTVYDVAIEGGHPWIVMELIRGLTLSEVLETEGPMPPRRAASLGGELIAALSAAHEAGVLHRDIKPGNVLLGNDGRVVLTDFGIAAVEGTSALTMTGELIGSPEFIAPELAMGNRPGPASDLWSLGVLLYATVEGASPFRQNTPLGTLRAVVDEELPPPRHAGPLTPVLEGLLRKDPALRTTAPEAAEQLRAVAMSDSTTPGGAGVPYMPTVTSPTPPPGMGTPPPTPPPGGTGTPSAGTPPVGSPSFGPATTSTGPPAGTRRGTRVLIAGLAVLALAGGGLAYALASGDDGKEKGAGGAGAGATSAATSEATTGGGGGGGKDDGDGDNGNGGGGGGSEQSVKVSVRTERGRYAGVCPPPHGRAPSFIATVTLGHVPDAVEYRWVTGRGTSSDPGWKSLKFASGDDRTKHVSHTETAYTRGSAYRNTIGVEVRAPVRVSSGKASFTVTCASRSPGHTTPPPASSSSPPDPPTTSTSAPPPSTSSSVSMSASGYEGDGSP
ncbi:serine/threonine-protein kinase [Streptomyces tsukubensis]|uniref:non-specific serine/threonine protein kinase n=1 Tax=Streptomyces tsukubensis TaxID=83656 RepID=A0A1V4AEU2_9ACTN|nr:serine/threonine-protein kinase [Streptomyces tsukubensis]OON82338.1 serine/threonine protein kinase [Streptomyces tsukubensis]QFR92834.1 protein kinase [Streptomyces tsukubensis]